MKKGRDILVDSDTGGKMAYERELVTISYLGG
jgi:hypothetical protein